MQGDHGNLRPVSPLSHEDRHEDTSQSIAPTWPFFTFFASFHRLLGFVAAFRDDVVRDLTAEEFPAVGHGQEEEDGGSGKAQGPDGKELGDGHPQTSGQENVQRQGQGATNETDLPAVLQGTNQRHKPSLVEDFRHADHTEGAKHHIHLTGQVYQRALEPRPFDRGTRRRRGRRPCDQRRVKLLRGGAEAQCGGLKIGGFCITPLRS